VVDGKPHQRRRRPTAARVNQHPLWYLDLLEPALLLVAILSPRNMLDLNSETLI